MTEIYYKTLPADLDTVNRFEAVEDRTDTVEAVVAQTRADVAELYRRLANNEDDDRTTAERVDTAMELNALLNERLNVQTEILKGILSLRASEADVTDEIDEIDDRLEIIDSKLALVENMADIDDDLFDNLHDRISVLEDRPENTTLEQISQRLAAIETRLNHIEYDPVDVTPVPPYQPTYPVYPTYPTYPNTSPPWVTYSDSADTGYETKDNT